MSYSLGLDASVNGYTFDYVNCFEKPLGIILANDEQHLQSWLWIYLKMLQCYRLESSVGSDVFYTIDFNSALLRILGQKLGYVMEHQKVQPDQLNDIVKKHIHSGHPALVPGNLRELPNSSYYGSGDWKHIFLIHGYDDERQLYTVTDTDHQPTGPVLHYKERQMAYELVDELFRSAGEHLHTSWVWSIHQPEDYVPPDEKELLLEALHWLIHRRSSQPYTELEYIERINCGKNAADACSEYISDEAGGVSEADDPVSKVDFMFLRSVKYKELLYRELHTVLKRCELSHESLEQLEQRRTQLCRLWSAIANQALVSHYLQQAVRLTEEMNTVLKEEEEMIQLLIHIEQEVRKVPSPQRAVQS